MTPPIAAPVEAGSTQPGWHRATHSNVLLTVALYRGGQDTGAYKRFGCHLPRAVSQRVRRPTVERVAITALKLGMAHGPSIISHPWRCVPQQGILDCSPALKPLRSPGRASMRISTLGSPVASPVGGPPWCRSFPSPGRTCRAGRGWAVEAPLHYGSGTRRDALRLPSRLSL